MSAEPKPIQFPRWCFAAAHISVHDEYRAVSHGPASPGAPDELAQFIDWDATLGIRRWLDGLGFGIAEAMDTAQRFAIGWTNAETLIRKTAALNLANGFIAGAGCDHLGRIQHDADLVEAVVLQARVIQECGGYPIILPLPWLSETNADAGRFIAVYQAIIDALGGPLFIHWLGPMFMSALRGYFPGGSFFQIMAHDPAKVRGAKLSLLDAPFERAARERLLASKQIILTGDDFNFAGLIKGENGTSDRDTVIGQWRVPIGPFSHALLGILDGIALPAATALAHLAGGRGNQYAALMERCETLGRWIFQEPTERYKPGLAFLAWLNELQPNPMLLNHEERLRDRHYYLETFRLAREAGALIDVERARHRLDSLDEFLAG